MRWPKDSHISVLLLLLSLLCTLPFLNALEYFRHTEADRTIIGWEMLKSGDYITPHLLGDVYLTKPPLFYSLLAASFAIFGAPYEWAARLVSALVGAVLIGANYYSLRLAQVPKEVALLSSLFLLCTVPIFLGSTTAEIDMLHTTLCALSLNFLFVAYCSSNSLVWVVLAWLLAALALLTKGPPIVLFLVCALGAYPLVTKFLGRAPVVAIKLFSYHAVGLTVLVAVGGSWLYFLLKHHQWSDLELLLDREILRRFTDDPKASIRERGFLYYPGAMLAGLVPWSFVFFYWPFKRKQIPAAAPILMALVTFCASILLPSLLVYGMASGKSHRYILPLYPCACQILAVAAWRLFDQKAFGKNFKILFAIMLLWRIPYASIYAKYRNETLSVKAIATQIESQVPKDEEIYILEMPERWLVYYLIRDGRTCLRLTPKIQESISSIHDKQNLTYLLLNCERENWKLEDLSNKSTQMTKLIGQYEHPKTRFCLYQVEREAISKLPLDRIFPDDYSHQAR